MVVIESIDLTSDSSDTEESFNEKEGCDELPFQCLKCPLKFGQMQDAQAHFLDDHQKTKKRVTFKEDYEVCIFERADYEYFSENEDTEKNLVEEENYCIKCDQKF